MAHQTLHIQLFWRIAHQTLQIHEFENKWLTKRYVYKGLQTHGLPNLTNSIVFHVSHVFNVFYALQVLHVLPCSRLFWFFEVFQVFIVFHAFHALFVFMVFQVFHVFHVFLVFLAGARAGAVGKKVSPCRCHFLCLPPTLKFMPVRGRARSP